MSVDVHLQFAFQLLRHGIVNADTSNLSFSLFQFLAIHGLLLNIEY